MTTAKKHDDAPKHHATAHTHKTVEVEKAKHPHDDEHCPNKAEVENCRVALIAAEKFIADAKALLRETQQSGQFNHTVAGELLNRA